MKKISFILSAVLAVLLAGCVSTGGTADEKAIAAGVKAWNDREPSAAAAYWADIQDAKTKEKYNKYISLYNEGVAALDDADSAKTESKKLSSCNTALTKFTALDSALKLPLDVCQKGAELSAGRISNLLNDGKVTAAKNMKTSAEKVYGTSPELAAVGKEIDTISAILAKKSSLDSDAQKIASISNFDEKIAAYDKVLADYTAGEGQLNSTAKANGVADAKSVATNMRAFRNARQNLAVERAGAIREEAYNYKNRIGEEFARSPEKGQTGDMSLDEILAHYESVQANIDTIYNEFTGFAGKYPKEVDQAVLDDIAANRKDLASKIAQIKAEIAHRKEVASRGKPVMPLMIGLFNPDPSSSAASQKSRPAKFSATNVKDDDYWWGMVSIPKNQMNDLVVTLKDNHQVHVYNQNTKSGKLIKKNNLEDLINRGSKVGNSWPVLNAGKALGGSLYFIKIDGDKNKKNYSGEVVVYSSFITRMR